MSQEFAGFPVVEETELEDAEEALKEQKKKMQNILLGVFGLIAC